MTVEDIHKRKELAVRDKILDFMGSTELIANLFRISQTEEKLKRNAIDSPAAANAAHHSVGREVRAAIERVGDGKHHPAIGALMAEREPVEHFFQVVAGGETGAVSESPSS